MIIKNNCVIGRNSLGMISPTPIITPIRKTFVGPLLEEEVCTPTPREGSPRISRVIRCPQGVGHGGPAYWVPVEAWNGPRASSMSGFEQRQEIMLEARRLAGADRPWRGVPYHCPLPGGVR